MKNQIKKFEKKEKVKTQTNKIKCNDKKSKLHFGMSSLESSVMLQGSVANRWRPLDGVEEVGTALAGETPGKLLFEDGTGELLPVTAKCSMLRPSQ